MEKTLNDVREELEQDYEEDERKLKESTDYVEILEIQERMRKCLIVLNYIDNIAR